MAEIEGTRSKLRTQKNRATEKLEEAMSGTSGKSKNTLIKEAIKILKD